MRVAGRNSGLSREDFVGERPTSSGLCALIIVSKVISNLSKFDLQVLIVGFDRRLCKTDLMERSFACRIATAERMRSLQAANGIDQTIQPGNAARNSSFNILHRGDSSP
jgi:hypothetical protein